MRALLLLVVADVFVLQSGAEVDGFQAGKTARKELIIGTATGTRKIAESLIKKTRPSADAAADFPKYFAALMKNDADGFAALGAWAKGRGLGTEAKQAFEKAVAIQPDHEAAKIGLGYQRVGGTWFTPEEVERRKKDDGLRTEMGDHYEKLLGVRPEVEVTDHWRCADFLKDEKILPRLQDLEAAFAEAVRVFGSDPWTGKGLVVLCQGQEQYLKWAGTDGAALPGMNPQFLDFVKKATGMKWTQPPVLARSDLPDRGAMHAAALHSAGHILLNNWRIHNRGQPFWIEEGFGGWMEATVLKTNSSYCFGVSKQGYGSSFRGTKAWEVDNPDWKDLAKQAALKNEFIPLDQLDMLPAGEYSRREVGQAFSLVAYLLKEKGEEKFRDYVGKVKGGEKSPVAFQKVFGETLETVEPAWKQFVQSAW